jgi:hypothetical protein
MSETNDPLTRYLDALRAAGAARARDERTNAREVLTATLRYVTSVSDPAEDLGAPLLDLLAELDGTRRPLGTPPRQPNEVLGRPMLRAREQAYRARAAAAMETLISRGTLRARSAQIVARMLNKQDPEIMAADIAEWRDALRAEWPREGRTGRAIVDAELGVDVFKQALQQLEGMPPSEAPALRRALEAWLAR